MAGMLPGVELARRRRVYHHHQYNDSNSRDHPSLLRDRLQPSSPSDLDEAALKARRRLEEKLGLGRLRSRFSSLSLPLLHFALPFSFLFHIYSDDRFAELLLSIVIGGGSELPSDVILCWTQNHDR
uniref:Uncharacterized protein n=1 Tax=Nelumbo nucifera TaxID=4432 RepID=A0A822XGW6_NELNU|nr:TPA_asm: hypothetical protein HUJ06_021093 [Nelumbo nucifera]